MSRKTRGKEVEVGISTSGQILARWRCQGCAKVIEVRTTVSDLIKIPEHEVQDADVVKHSKVITPDDLLFLKSMNISDKSPE